jgi:hypothetical protein
MRTCSRMKASSSDLSCSISLTLRLPPLSSALPDKTLSLSSVLPDKHPPPPANVMERVEGWPSGACREALGRPTQ